MHLDSLLITTDAKNIASQRVAEKCGFKLIADYTCNDIDSHAYNDEIASKDYGYYIFCADTFGYCRGYGESATLEHRTYCQSTTRNMLSHVTHGMNLSTKSG